MVELGPRKEWPEHVAKQVSKEMMKAAKQGYNKAPYGASGGASLSYFVELHHVPSALSEELISTIMHWHKTAMKTDMPSRGDQGASPRSGQDAPHPSSADRARKKKAGSLVRPALVVLEDPFGYPIFSEEYAPGEAGNTTVLSLFRKVRRLAWAWTARASTCASTSRPRLT